MRSRIPTGALAILPDRARATSLARLAGPGGVWTPTGRGPPPPSLIPKQVFLESACRSNEPDANRAAPARRRGHGNARADRDDRRGPAAAGQGPGAGGGADGWRSAEHHRPAHRRPGDALDAGDEGRRQGAQAQGRHAQALLRQLPAVLPRAVDAVHGPVRPQPRGALERAARRRLRRLQRAPRRQLPAVVAAGCRLPDLLHRQVRERLRRARRVRDDAHRRPAGLGRLARARPIARPVLQLHAQSKRHPAPVLGRGRGLQHRRLHEQGAQLHPLQLADPDPVLSRARLRGSARWRRRRSGPVVQSRRRPGAARPRHAQEEGEGLAAAFVQRGGDHRQAVADRRQSPAHARADRGHAAQAPLCLGVPARGRRQRRRDHEGAPARQGPPQHLRLLSLRQRLHARRAPGPRQQALPLRGVGAGPVHRPRPGDPARRELRRRGRQRRPDLDHPAASAARRPGSPRTASR